MRGVASGTYFHNKPEKHARYRIYETAGGTIHEVGVRIWDRETRKFGEPIAGQVAIETTSAIPADAGT